MSLFGRTGKGAPFDWLVVGLGNPGPKYIGTRHNVGEDVVKLLAERHREQLKGGRDNALTAETRFRATGNDERVVLSFPITYMNESGQAVGAQVRRYRIPSVDRIIVIHDELDLDPGILRVKEGGGLAGHNGLRSITAHTKSQDYLRVRIGVGKPPSGAGKNYVLSKVPKSERERLDIAVVDAADAVELIISDGVEAAMRRYNIKQ
jgi:PTH1 family peptidyl-tRNA hydrolase|tara:strand:+ start:542 stop:1159 length:618 start_codon:yes stop_codon:yes gene_type:complete